MIVLAYNFSITDMGQKINWEFLMYSQRVSERHGVT